jgi:hypothetical protein
MDFVIPVVIVFLPWFSKMRLYARSGWPLSTKNPAKRMTLKNGIIIPQIIIPAKAGIHP